MPITAPANPATSRANGMFRALSHRNFRWFWAGAFLSNVGTWMQMVAQGWLVLQITDSPFWLGVDGFMGTAPGLLLTLAAGVFADLIDRRRILLFTQLGAGLSALALGLLVMAGVVNDRSDVWIVLALTFLTGCCMAIAGPAYQSITIDLVGREDLTNAIALNSTQFQLSRAVGPTLAGFGFKLFGLAGCFLANSLSYLAVVTAMMNVDLTIDEDKRRRASTVKRKEVWSEMIDGFRYVWRRPRVFTLLILSSITTFFGAPYVTLVPHFARDILHLDASGLSLMMAVAGAGAFVGAVTLTFLGNFERKGWSVLSGAFAFAICLIGFSLSKTLWVSLGFLFGMGVAIVFSVAVINILLQKLVVDEMRGRVMSMFVFTFLGPMPIGSFIAGALSERFTAPLTLAAGGGIIALIVVVESIRNPRLRNLN